MDRVSLVASLLHGSYGAPALMLAHCHRQSSLRQEEVAWKAWQAWLTAHHPSEHVSVSSVLSFLISLAEVRHLSLSTIACYRSSLRLLAAIDVAAFPFPDLIKALYLRCPPTPPRPPPWSLDKVLALLQTPPFVGPVASDYNVLRHCLFLVAWASGNRVSELSALIRPPTFPVGSEPSVALPVRPGFLYKNQRRGRAPPNVSVSALPGPPRSLCSVRSLARDLYLCTPVATPLSTRPRSHPRCALSSMRPTQASSLEHMMCERWPRPWPGRGASRPTRSSAELFGGHPPPSSPPTWCLFHQWQESL